MRRLTMPIGRATVVYWFVMLAYIVTIYQFSYHEHDGALVSEKGFGSSRQLALKRRTNDSTIANAGPSPPPGTEPTLIVAAIHQGYGTHFVDLYCGTPPQRQTLIVDTGSDVTGFVCAGCRRCGGHHHVFDPEASKTFRELSCSECLQGECAKGLRNAPGQCRLEASYREGSGWKATEAADVCHVGSWTEDQRRRQLKGNGLIGGMSEEAVIENISVSQNRFPLKFACQTSVSGAFRSQLEDGIAGLERSRTSLWKQIYSAGAIPRRAFALCFSRSLNPSTDGTALAGIMTLGGYDDSLHASPMVFSKGTYKDSASEYFVVRVRKVYLREGGGGNSTRSTNPDLKVIQLDIQEEDLNQEQVIIDSGSTDTYFTKKLEAPFQEVWKQLTGKHFNNEIEPQLTGTELDKLPTMLFQLRGDADYNRERLNHESATDIPGLAGSLDPDHPFDVLIAVPPAYYYEYIPEDERYNSRFHFDPNYDSALGASAMLGHNIFFDIENKRIGWAESSCDYDTFLDTSLTTVTTEGRFKTDDIRLASTYREASETVSRRNTQSYEHMNVHNQTHVRQTRDIHARDAIKKKNISFSQMIEGLEAAAVFDHRLPQINVCSSIFCRICVGFVLYLVGGWTVSRILRRSEGKHDKQRRRALRGIMNQFSQ